MNQSGNKQWQRKTQSLLASLMYRLAQGTAKTEPFATLLQQIFNERIKANPVNTDLLKNSMSQVKLDKLPKTKKLKREFAHSLALQQQKEKTGEQLVDNRPFTMGQIVNGWAGLTGQDETEFVSKVSPKIRELVIKHYKATGQLGLTDSQSYENPESAFNFMTDLFDILVDETPSDKKNSLIELMKALITSSAQSAAEVDSEFLHNVSTMITSSIATKLTGALSGNPSAKDRLLHPLFAELVAIEGKTHGWDTGVPADNHAQLQSELSQNGVSPNKRMRSRSLKRLGRKNVLQNVNDALDGNLVENLNNIISEQMIAEQDKTQSIWEFSPISPKDTAETEKSVREWLFRRNEK